VSGLADNSLAAVPPRWSRARSRNVDGGLTTHGQPWAIAVNAASVYWVDAYFNEVWRSPK